MFKDKLTIVKKVAISSLHLLRSCEKFEFGLVYRDEEK